MIQASVVRVAGSVRKGKATVMATTSVQGPSSVAWTTAIDQSKILGLPTMTAVINLEVAEILGNSQDNYKRLIILPDLLIF